MDRSDRQRRDRQVLALARQGMSSATIATIVGLTDRHVRRILGAARKSAHLHPVEDIDGVEAAEEHLHQLDQAIADVALLGRAATTDAGQLQALKARVRLLDQRKRYLQELGVMPTDLSLAPSVSQVLELHDQLLAVLDHHGVGQEAKRDVTRVLTAWAAAEREAA